MQTAKGETPTAPLVAPRAGTDPGPAIQLFWAATERAQGKCPLSCAIKPRRCPRCCGLPARPCALLAGAEQSQRNHSDAMEFLASRGKRQPLCKGVTAPKEQSNQSPTADQNLHWKWDTMGRCPRPACPVLAAPASHALCPSSQSCCGAVGVWQGLQPPAWLGHILQHCSINNGKQFPRTEPADDAGIRAPHVLLTGWEEL